MTAQTAQNQETVAVFKSRQEADKARQAVQSSGLKEQCVHIDDHVSSTIQMSALGTTIGGQAGLWMGVFLGGTLGLIATIVISFWMTGDYPDSLLSRLIVIGSAIAGAVFGSLVGKGLWDSQPANQKMKGNPDVPRQFRLVVEGSSEDLRRARQALNQPPVD
ncbi:MAG: hypothetical protein WBG38_02150 [Nodosilinea sp.]